MVREASPAIGVLLFESAGERRMGDPGLPGSFPFPVLFGVVPGSYRDLIEGSPAICEKLCRTAKDLARQGAAAIAGDCGLMSLYQRELADQAGVPVISSSLILLPILRQITGQDRSIGILTGHSQLLGYSHLIAAGAGCTEGLVIQGMEEEPHFRQAILEGSGPHDYDRMKQDVLHAVERLLARSPKTGALLLECSNLATYGYEISRQFSLPVFDIGTAIHFLHHGISKTNYRP